MPDLNTASRNSVWQYVVAAAISLVGLGDAIYLTVQDLTGQNLRCTIITGCAEVLGSRYAHVGPMPLAMLGAAAYFSFFSLAVLVVFGYSFARPLLAVLVAIMFMTALWLTYLQAFVIHHFCQYCLLSAGVTTILTIIVGLSFLTSRRS
jgi:uncharacterized membrane protein